MRRLFDKIAKLKKQIDIASKEKNKPQDATNNHLQRVQAENVELRKVIDQLSAENSAAKEIKSFVLKMREKNTVSYDHTIIICVCTLHGFSDTLFLFLVE